MRSVAEYREMAAKFAAMAAAPENAMLKKRYSDLADCYQLLAEERQRLIEEKKIEAD